MPDTQEVANNHEYRNLPIAILVESPTNPRKRFELKNASELAASFKTQGVLEPLLVRPLEASKFEVVIGARRESRTAGGTRNRSCPAREAY